MDDVHPLRVGSVEVDQLTGFGRSVGSEAARGFDHLLLTDHADLRFGGVALGKLGVLHLGHGVHRVHERHAPALRREPADLSTEPVVRMNEVVPTLRAARFDAHHAGGYGA